MTPEDNITAEITERSLWFEPLLEKDLLPDFILRAAIRYLVGGRLQQQSQGGVEAQNDRLMRWVEQLKHSPVAIDTDAANQQHYEVPAEFYKLVLGPRLKYSGGYWPQGVDALAASEEAMLELTVNRAALADGQDVLELGCGWGSLSLYMAEHYPNSRITAVSNSRSQKEFIDAEAVRRGLGNLQIVTADMRDFDAGRTFDRIVSVEMFEHMRNYQELLRRVSTWMKPDARLFVHIFTHARFAYPFEARDSGDWMAKHFFTGGQMPSDDLLLYFQDDVRIVEHWRVDGTHYQKTSEAWLQRMDQNRDAVKALFARVYGPGEATRWIVRWRVFFLACAELFGYKGGEEWLVSHYLFARR
jgi:cyclopropane-fatty-acyl-phospholipid synthase